MTDSGHGLAEGRGCPRFIGLTAMRSTFTSYCFSGFIVDFYISFS